VQLERWLGENDLLFLRRDHAEPLVLLPWRVWAALLAKVAAMSTRQRLPQRRASTTSPLAAALDAIHNSEKANGL